MSTDEEIMTSALKLAARGIASVEPNPAVGCIIVKAGQVIGRGWHRKFGGPHAEINALADCETLGVKPEGATMYVTLEPCCHEGKTGPCTQAIIAARLAKVVVATIDPSAHASGKGIGQLQNAGIEVQVGVCESQAKLLNAPFFKFVTTGKPWVVAKWAQSIDGKVAYAQKSDEQQLISNELSRADAHKLRRRVGAIVVGVNTVIADNPMLTPRPSRGKRPIRVVLDRSLRIRLGCRLLHTTKTSPTVVCTTKTAAKASPNLVERIVKKGAEVLVCPAEKSNLNFLLSELGKRGVQQVLVEGGPKVLTSFLKEGLADEICVYIAPKILGGSGAVPISEAMSELTGGVGLHHVDIKPFGNDVRLTGLTKVE